MMVVPKSGCFMSKNEMKPTKRKFDRVPEKKLAVLWGVRVRFFAKKNMRVILASSEG